jgi:hypothetical protein
VNWPSAVWIIVTCSLAFFAAIAAAFAKCVTVKYRAGMPVCLDTSECTKTPQSSFVREVCYDAAQSCMLIGARRTASNTNLIAGFRDLVR